ncbi:MAG: endonuclease domain-containing protein [Magnetospirillum sp.]|nr:endonuclease domain-containing protein [Magnetospirillum sp.]
MVTWKPKTQIERARKLRTELATEVEKRLWRRLRAGQLDGARIRRQHPLGPYILDFVCIDAKLVVELDGGQHADPEHATYDERRTAYLRHEGYVVLRFWSNDVIDNLEGVLDVIKAALGDKPQVENS